MTPKEKAESLIKKLLPFADGHCGGQDEQINAKEIIKVMCDEMIGAFTEDYTKEELKRRLFWAEVKEAVCNS